ncbi:hypothetical protein C8R46DRAFT_1363614 [Mycena filopes]|nr:hypothetical protein C8R46DRAFT_1363614 [Mycena filopes]
MDPSTDYLLSLPVELWLACWTLCSRHQLRRISLTCRLFRALTFPLLLQDQSFDIVAPQNRLSAANWEQRARYLHRTAVRLEKLREAPYVGYVRSWKVVLGNGYIPFLGSHAYVDTEARRTFDDMYNKVVTTFCATLARYRNLTTLHIQHFTLLPLIEALTSLSSLTELRLDNCHITEALRDLNLQTLEISGVNPLPQAAESLTIASPANLRNLFVSTQLPQLITGFGAQRMPALVQLSVQVVRHVEQFFSFLQRCPLLESLVVNGFYRDTTLPHSVPAQTIPRLRSLAGPSALISLLAPGRPLTTVRMVRHGHDPISDADTHHILAMCLDIAHGSAGLHSLHLPHPGRSPDNLLATITSLFPDLRELVLTIPVSPVFRNVSLGGRRAAERLEAVDKFLDDEAFDDIPADELSDAAAEEASRVPALIVRPTPWARKASVHRGAMHATLDWILGESVVFAPHNLEVLSMEAAEGLMLERLFEAEQYQAIAALLLPCPRLQQVRFGPATSGWRRVGEVWRSEATGACIRIVAADE